ncbi:MAG: nucleotidyl transferase AbiEii/AbiGii toxin family protein [Bacteroidales bacterium]
MFLDILDEGQKSLLPFVFSFKRHHFLVGGTALALQIGHRRSIDFDLFTQAKLNHATIKNKLKDHGIVYQILHEESDQLHVLAGEVKLTWFQFPYRIPVGRPADFGISIPSIASIAAMKAFALGGRGKWKDYVDLYFVLKYHSGLNEVSSLAREYFGSSFNEKLFRQQLSYFDDMDYSESLEYLVSSPPGDQEIKDFLSNIALQPF